ncbi:hypothetical protein PR048_013101 [Dryococelus australis]|uniref:Uncharacterized protein n=1 Tax=Dryococelus australis TaxID=614101 RepID=A0ABQ9HR84_9NEOP|nr:hypothetical protein PR048_013101 [Dryococelus australis]
MSILKQGKIPHFTFNPKTTVFTMVLRGFIPSISEQELEQLLKEEDIEDKKPLQCYKCQCFGYHSKCCGQEEKCFKCAGNHHSKYCLRDTDANIPIKYANCGVPHSAGDRNCRKWQ